MKQRVMIAVALCLGLTLGIGATAVGAEPVSETREVEAFDKVRFSARGNLYIRQGEKCSLRLEAEQSDLDKVQISVEQGRLIIEQKRSWLSWADQGKLNAYVTMRAIKDIDAGGSVHVIGESTITSQKISLKGSGSTRIKLTLRVKALSTKLSGSGEAVLRGSAVKHEFKASGSADLKAFDLITENTSLKISGSGKASVFVNKEIRVRISGSGEVRIKGPGKVKSQKISGSGEIKRVD